MEDINNFKVFGAVGFIVLLSIITTFIMLNFESIKDSNNFIVFLVLFFSFSINTLIMGGITILLLRRNR